MRLRTAVLALFSLLALPGFTPVTNSQYSDWTGTWVGRYATGESAGTVRLTILQDDQGAWSAELVTTSPEYPSEEPDAVYNLEITENRIAFSSDWGIAVYWEGEREENRLSGYLSTDHFEGTWEVERQML